MKRRAQNEADNSSDDGSDASDAEELLAAGFVDPNELQPQKEFIYNKAGLLAALDDIKQDLPWIERLDVTAASAVTLDNADNDLDRELQFYNQAFSAVQEARKRFDALNEPYYRPEDYFAEMMKSDAHMQKIKDKLLFEQKKMEAVEQRKKQQEARKFARQVQAEKLKERAAQKKDTLEAVKLWKKQKDSRGGLADDKELNQMLSATTAKPESRKRKAEDEAAKKGRKRFAKDKKYGFGGKKRYAKENDSKSTTNTKGFSNKKNKALFKGMAMKKKKR